MYHMIIRSGDTKQRCVAPFGERSTTPCSLCSSSGIQQKLSFVENSSDPSRLYHKCGPNEYMSYVDFCSLYPWGVKRTRFPVGHPKIFTENFKPITAQNNPYFGVIKCTVLPPHQLLHPVLPYKCNGTELGKALEMGYKVVKVHKVWHYEETEQHEDEMTGLFTRYINCFLKLKIKASGWPHWVQTEQDQQDRFIQECEEREGIKLNPKNIDKNAGLRSLAKLCLNSFWGKFGQRSNMPKDEFVCDTAKFSEIIFNETNIVEHIRVMSEEMLYVTYSKEENYIELMSHTNPVIAAFCDAVQHGSATLRFAGPETGFGTSYEYIQLRNLSSGLCRDNCHKEKEEEGIG